MCALCSTLVHRVHATEAPTATWRKRKYRAPPPTRYAKPPRPCSGGFSKRSLPDRLMRWPTPMPTSRKPCRSPLPCMRAEAKAALARKDVSTGQGLAQALPLICSPPATPRRDAPKRKCSAKSTPTSVLRTGADDDCCSPLPDTRPPDSSSSRETPAINATRATTITRPIGTWQRPHPACLLRSCYAHANSRWPSERNLLDSAAVALPDLVTGPVFKLVNRC